MITSSLMVAGDKEKHLDKINDLKCGIAIINLEDGVFDKKYALELLLKKFGSNGLRVANKQIVVRINPLSSTGCDEIKVINTLRPNAIRVSKIRTIEDVEKALELIDETIEVHLSIETKEALDNLSKLKCEKRVTTVYLGILDMLESLGLPQSLLELDNPTIDYILSKFLIDSHIAGFKAVSFTFQDYKDTDKFTQWCKKEKKMGFSCKSCISPAQVRIANEIFGISEDEILKAKYIKEIFEQQKSLGITGFSDLKYGFIDEPIYKDALLVLGLNKY
ncbi:MAG: CoA ester lyase [Arcobacteraceae bacterium]|nr:CoA ester lyase [Arcobacteraceae bacterium]